MSHRKSLENTPQQAMDSALHLLKFRRRSAGELGKRLGMKGFSSGLVERTLSRLKELGLLDDASLASDWVQAGRRGGQADLRIRQKLLQRGLDRTLIDESLKALSEENVGSEEDRAWGALTRRARRMASVDPAKARQRLAGYLLRQGYAYDTVQKVLRRYFSSHSEE